MTDRSLLVQLTERLGSFNKVRHCLGEVLCHHRKKSFPHSGVVCVKPSDFFLREHTYFHELGADRDQGHRLQGTALDSVELVRCVSVYCDANCLNSYAKVTRFIVP